MNEEVPSVNPKLDAMCEMLTTIHDLSERNKVLEKENAELKVENAFCEKACEGATMMYKHLTKAKAILREFVDWANWQGSNCPSFKSIQDKAEQFLKEMAQ